MAKLAVADTGGALNELIKHFRGPDVADQVEPLVGHDVVITHDGKLLFAYAADQSTLTAARSAIEGVLREDGITATVRVGHWDEELDEWRQTDPPLTEDEARRQQLAERDAETVQTRTMVAKAGREIRAEFEQTMKNWADKLGLECNIVEHPHLLVTQVAFSVTGPRYKLDEFARGLTAEEWALIRTQRWGTTLGAL